MGHNAWKITKTKTEHNEFKQGDTVWFLAWDDGPAYWLECGVLDIWQHCEARDGWRIRMSYKNPPANSPYWETFAEENVMGHTKDEALKKALKWLSDQILYHTEIYSEDRCGELADRDPCAVKVKETTNEKTQ